MKEIVFPKYIVLMLVTLLFHHSADAEIMYEMPFSPGEEWKVDQTYMKDCLSDPNWSHCSTEKSGLQNAIDLNYYLGGNSDLGRLALATASGVVIAATCDIPEPMSKNEGYGCYVDIDHGEEWTRTAHCLTLTVQTYDSVVQGQHICLVGSTGASTFAHIHYERHEVLERNADGVITRSRSIRPEPMGNQLTFEEGEHIFSTNFPSQVAFVGYHENSNSGFGEIDPQGQEIRSNSESEAFAVAHRRGSYRNKALNLYPVEDPCCNEGELVHCWKDGNNQCTFGIDVQNFYNGSDYSLNGAIVYDESKNKAFVVSRGMWERYGQFGPGVYGAPQSDEIAAEKIGGQSVMEQEFEKGKLRWHPSFTGDFNDQIVWKPGNQGGITASSSVGTVRAAGNFTGSDEATFGLSTTSIQHNQITFSVQNDSNMGYDSLRLYRDGVLFGTYAGNSSGFTDSTVQPNTTYRYHLEGTFETWGTVSVSEAITLTTPPLPGTYQLVCSARSERTVDCEVLNSMYTANAHVLYRDGLRIASSVGTEFTDHGIGPESTHDYYAQAITWDGIVLGSSNYQVITTPADTGTDPAPDPPAPPVDPSLPLRLIEGVTLVDGPALINGCNTIRYVVQNVGTGTLFIDRFSCEAEVDMGFQAVTKYCAADQFQPPTELNAGQIYTFERDTCGNPWPSIYSTAVITPVYKKYTVGGEFPITDTDPNATGTLSVEILEGDTNPDLKVVDVRMVPENPFNYEPVAVEFDVQNIGDREADPAGFRMFLWDEIERNNSTPNLDPSETTTISFNLGVLPEGVDQVTYAIDPNEYVHESNEENNTGSFYFRIAEPIQDADSDGIEDGIDNCPNVSNPSQADSDEDAIGDACDTCPADALNDQDADGICGNIDNCPATSNTSQSDSDSDGVGDACDLCPSDNPDDPDNDGVCQSDDNCPLVANSDQLNGDADSFGDTCDNCPPDANEDQLDSDGNGIGDACEVVQQFPISGSFSIADIRWNNEANLNDDVSWFYGTYSLDGSSDGIDPLREDVTLELSTQDEGVLYSETIPSGDPRWSHNSFLDKYEFDDPSKPGLNLIRITGFNDTIELRSENASFIRILKEGQSTEVVNITVTIGNDVLEKTLTMSAYAYHSNTYLHRLID